MYIHLGSIYACVDSFKNIPSKLSVSRCRETLTLPPASSLLLVLHCVLLIVLSAFREIEGSRYSNYMWSKRLYILAGGYMYKLCLLECCFCCDRGLGNSWPGMLTFLPPPPPPPPPHTCRHTQVPLCTAALKTVH